MSAVPFGASAAWYDAFHADKDYAAEARYLLERVSRWKPTPRTWLDVGCGTGQHLAHLQSLGLSVEGVDRSEAMISEARRQRPRVPFHVGSAQTFRLPGPRAVVSVLFHGMSYQATDTELGAALANLAAHLAVDGVLVFDFWNTEGVLREPPTVRTRQARVEGRVLYRTSHPTERRAQRQVDVRFEFRWDAPDGPLAHEELHALRHFAPGELDGLLRAQGLELLDCQGWLRDREPGPDDWYGLALARVTP